MTKRTPNDTSLIGLLPPIRRARGYRLYDIHGGRYIDLDLAAGRALLGYRPDGVLHELKNLASRGLTSDLPSVFERRLAMVVSKLVPDHPDVRVFANEERLLAALNEVFGEKPTLVDPVVTDLESPTADGAVRSYGRGVLIWRWRPYLAGNPYAMIERSVALPVLPFPGSFSPAVACLRGFSEADLPPSDLVSPALLGALTRSAYDLLRFMKEANYGEPWWERFEGPWWERRGPYLVARCKKREYSEVFRRLLEKGIHISSAYPGPSVVPAECTDGELKPLQDLARDWKGG